ncbi:MAG: helix-turn-helix domain-containing protein [Mogibacterium kristiansenii]|uniref:helix-turn-helix domain-containing protein n=1 Tax=Mogibacterium kristiansenii TaxID=2606708 RepID=UPI003F0FE538
MNGKFGEFIAEKRKAKGMTLRGLAAEIGIVPAFMSDIEKGHRYPPKKETLDKIVQALNLNEEDTNKMFDLAAEEKDNTVSPDLPKYIMNNDKVRVALRLARDSDASDKTWQKVIELLEKENKAD